MAAIDALLAGLRGTEASLRPLVGASGPPHVDAKAALDRAVDHIKTVVNATPTTLVTAAFTPAPANLTAEHLLVGFRSAEAAAGNGATPALVASSAAIQSALVVDPDTTAVQALLAAKSAAEAAPFHYNAENPLDLDNSYATTKSVTIIAAATSVIASNASSLKALGNNEPDNFVIASRVLLIISMVASFVVILIAGWLVHHGGPVSNLDRFWNTIKMIIYIGVGAINVIISAFLAGEVRSDTAITSNITSS